MLSRRMARSNPSQVLYHSGPVAFGIEKASELQASTHTMISRWVLVALRLKAQLISYNGSSHFITTTINAPKHNCLQRCMACSVSDLPWTQAALGPVRNYRSMSTGQKPS